MKKITPTVSAIVAYLVLFGVQARSAPVLINGPVRLQIQSHLGAGHEPSIDLSATGDIYMGWDTPSVELTGDSTITAGVEIRISAQQVALGQIELNAPTVVIDTTSEGVASIDPSLIAAPVELTLTRLALRIDPALVTIDPSLTAAGVTVTSAAGNVTLTADSPINYTVSPQAGGAVIVSAGSISIEAVGLSGRGITPASQTAAPLPAASPQPASAVPLDLFWPYPLAPSMALDDQNPIEVTGDVLLLVDSPIHNATLNADGSILVQHIPEPSTGAALGLIALGMVGRNTRRLVA